MYAISNSLTVGWIFSFGHRGVTVFSLFEIIEVMNKNAILNILFVLLTIGCKWKSK